MNDFDTAVLVLRLLLGPMLILHGLNKVFGGGGLAGTARWFEGLGLRPGWLHARVAATNEIGSGALMTLGLLTPLAAAAFVGLMIVAAFTDHRGNGYFVFKGGWEYVAMVAGVAAVIATLGPGRASLDHALSIERSGLGWGATALGVGLLVGVGFLATFRSALDRARAGTSTSAS